MPACGPGWVLVPGTWMTSGTLSTILREVLVLQGIPREEVETYASHSMETTFLSWAGKSGRRPFQARRHDDRTLQPR